MTEIGPRILIVDDIEDNRYTLGRRLTRQGYSRIDEACDGREALDLMDQHAYDLVLLDIMMPEVDGYQVLETLQASGRIGDPPVIMVSALDEMESVVRCIKLGAEDYLPKPFNATLLKARIGAVLQKKELRDAVKASHDRMQKELNAARVMQLGMVPTDFPVEGAECNVSLFATMEPAREVGGDLYDFFFPTPDILCFAIGDVSDKGTSAALFMARTRSSLRVCVTLMHSIHGSDVDPGMVLNAVNKELCQNNPDRMFTSLVLGLLDLRTGRLAYANAGHPPPVQIPQHGEISRLAAPPRPPLGATQRAKYDSFTASLAPNDVLFTFTDGVTDAIDTDEVFLGEPRLLEALAPGDTDPKALIASIRETIANHTGDHPAFDDVTMLALRWSPQA